MTASELVHALDLRPHPEGGFYRESYRSSDWVTRADGERRSASTAIDYLLCDGAYSAWHRIQSDEIWHFYAGTTLLVHELLPDGQLRTHTLGATPPQTVFQTCVQAGHWFAAELADPSSFALVGCTVAPGFEFSEFELAETDQLLQTYPDHATLIHRLASSPGSGQASAEVG